MYSLFFLVSIFQVLKECCDLVTSYLPNLTHCSPGFPIIIYMFLSYLKLSWFSASVTSLVSFTWDPPLASPLCISIYSFPGPHQILCSPYDTISNDPRKLSFFRSMFLMGPFLLLLGFQIICWNTFLLNYGLVRQYVDNSTPVLQHSKSLVNVC